MAFHIFRLSLSDFVNKALLQNQRLKAQGVRRKEKHVNGCDYTL